MKKVIIGILTIAMAWPASLSAQKLISEKTYEVDRKAKRGFLDKAYTNATDKTTTLSFVTKAGGGKIKFQDYIFDKDYNYVKTVEGEREYNNKRYKGENYSVEAVSVESSMLGKLVLRKKLIEFKWSWFNGRYYKKVTLLDKVKPKDEAGNSYYLLKKFENDETGDVIALVKAAGKTANSYEHFFIRIDKNLNFEVTDKITFDLNYGFFRAFLVPATGADVDDEKEDTDEDISQSDVCFIFTASPFQKKEDPHDYAMLRVSAQGKILNKVDFKVKANAWNIEKVVATKGSLYFVGPANEGKYQEEKYKFYQLLKMNNDKVEYCTLTDMDDFEAKLKKPASQKKNPAYKGKRFRIEEVNVGPDGSFFLCGQNFKEAEWQDVLMFYFDPTGVLKAQYGVRLDERNSDSERNHARMFIDFGKSSAYWTVWELVGFKEEKGNGESKPKSLIYPNIAKIDLGTGEIGEFVKFGTVKDKPTYFLQNKFPYLVNPDDGSIIYLGVDRSGDVLWFGKALLD